MTGEEVFDAYLRALGAGDRATALRLVEGLLAEGVPRADVIGDLVGPAQARVGELWLTDAWSVAQEHVATAVSEAVLVTLGVAAQRAADEAAAAAARARLAGGGPVVPGPPAAREVLVACVEQEWHALPALIVAEELRAAGHRVAYLGANSSAAHLVRHIHETGPRAVALSCSLSSSLPRVRRQIEAVRETGTPVLVGGSAFDGQGRRASALGATAYAATGAEAAVLLGALPPATVPARPLTHDGAIEALVLHAERETVAASVRVTLARHLGDPEDDERWWEALDDHLPHLVGAVAGALVTDDPSVLSDDLAWTSTMLAHRAAPRQVDAALHAALAIGLREFPVASRLLTGLADLADPAEPA